MDTWQIQAFYKKIVHLSSIHFKHSYSTAFLSAREAQCLQRGTEMMKTHFPTQKENLTDKNLAHNSTGLGLN